MKKVSKFLSIIVTLVIVMTFFAGCSSGSGPAANSSDKGDVKAPAEYIIGFSNVNDIYPYCIKFRDYLVAGAEKEGFKVIVADAKGDSAVQNGQVDNFLVQNAKIITAISVDLDGSVPAAEAAKKADVPYISFLTSVRNEGGYDKYIYIGSQNHDAGLLQGEYLAKVLPKDAKILYLTGQPNDTQYIDRKQGLIDGLKSRADVKIVAEQNSNNSKDLGLSITEDWMQANDKIDCIVGQNDDSILGAIEALKSANRLNGVITVGLDGSVDALASIEKGELSMSVLQDAKGQAEAAVNVFKQIRDGTDPKTIKDVFVPFQTITKDNVAKFK